MVATTSPTSNIKQMATTRRTNQDLFHLFHLFLPDPTIIIISIISIASMFAVGQSYYQQTLISKEMAGLEIVVIPCWILARWSVQCTQLSSQRWQSVSSLASGMREENGTLCWTSRGDSLNSKRWRKNRLCLLSFLFYLHPRSLILTLRCGMIQCCLVSRCLNLSSNLVHPTTTFRECWIFPPQAFHKHAVNVRSYSVCPTTQQLITDRVSRWPTPCSCHISWMFQFFLCILLLHPIN